MDLNVKLSDWGVGKFRITEWHLAGRARRRWPPPAAQQQGPAAKWALLMIAGK